MQADDSPLEARERKRSDAVPSESAPRSRMIRLPGEVLQIQMQS
jgi:hypothetical protein